MPLPPVAVTIEDAIARAAWGCQFMHESALRSLQLQMNLWVQTLFVPAQYIDESVNNRVVRNWLPPSQRALVLIPSGGPGASGQLDADRCTQMVWRALNAVRFGVLAGFVTVAQRTAAIAAWNLSWAT